MSRRTYKFCAFRAPFRYIPETGSFLWLSLFGSLCIQCSNVVCSHTFFFFFFSLLRLIVCNTAVSVMQKCPCNWYVPRTASVPHGWRRGQPSGLAAREARGNLAQLVLLPRDSSRVSTLEAVGALGEIVFSILQNVSYGRPLTVFVFSLQ